MKKYELTPVQNKDLETRFLVMSMPREGWVSKFERITEQTASLARMICTITPDSPEQKKGLDKLQEALSWFELSIKRNEI